MQDLWTALEGHTGAWRDLDRQGLADAVWQPYVTARFGHSGDDRALKFLYPYLNHGNRATRRSAISVAAKVFKGSGPSAIESLDYFTRNSDPFVKDRAVEVVGSAVAGWSAEVVLDILSPYLSHRSRFIRSQAVTALSRATLSSAEPEVVERILSVSKTTGQSGHELALSLARVCSGNPSDAVYRLVVDRDVAHGWRGSDMAAGILLQNAGIDWFELGLKDFFQPRLNADPDGEFWPANAPLVRWPQFVHRSAIEGLSRASHGRGVDALEHMLHLRHNACTVHSLLSDAPACFSEVTDDPKKHRSKLMAWLREGDVPLQRIAAGCLGVLLHKSEDEEAVSLLQDLTEARNRAVAAAAAHALGLVCQSACNETLLNTCLELTREAEAATHAVNAIGKSFQGSGRVDVLHHLQECAEFFRHRAVRGRKHCRPLAMCYRAMGHLYQGTGSMEPVDTLLDVLSSTPVSSAYRESAGRALVMIEFSEQTFTRAFPTDWI